MKLKVKNIDIEAGGNLICILNKEDAKRLDLHALDRVKIKKGRKLETVIIDLANSTTTLPKGKIGLFEEVEKKLKLKNNDIIEIIPAKKPLSIKYIKKKMEGHKLTKEEIDQIVWDIVHNKLSEVELTYFVSACYSQRLTWKETITLTKAMTKHGDILKLSRYPIIDKHCIGGVAGNRTTMILVPIVAAAGLTIPKTSSRSITSPAGTADTMEVLAKVSVSLDRMKEIIEKAHGCIVWGGALNLAPADDKFIRVERPMSIDAESQLLASIMAKKKSVSSTHILIDIPMGRGSKVKTKKEAEKLKKDFQRIARSLGTKVRVIITDGSEPIGNGIGPLLEARDILYILKNDRRGPEDLRKKSLMMAGLVLEMGGKAPKFRGYRMAEKIIESGKAYDKMMEIIRLQGGKKVEPDDLKPGKFEYDFKAPKYGKVTHIRNSVISKIARIAGAPESKKAGIYIQRHKGELVIKDEILFTIFAESESRLQNAIDICNELAPYEIH